MSYTEIYLVPQSGGVELYRELRNSWHGAILLWSHLSERYLGESLSLAMMRDGSRLWNLVKDTRLSRDERIALATTFDRVMVKQEHFRLVADAIDRMIREPNSAGHWGNWPAQADALRYLALDSMCFAVAWNQTSVNDDTWTVYEEGKDEEEEYEDEVDSRPYDLSRDSGHWFLFDHYPELLGLVTKDADDVE